MESEFKPRHILISEVKPNYYNVVVDGERFAEALCWDEVIGSIAAEILKKPSHVRYPMQSPTMRLLAPLPIAPGPELPMRSAFSQS